LKRRRSSVGRASDL